MHFEQNHVIFLLSQHLYSLRGGRKHIQGPKEGLHPDKLASGFNMMNCFPISFSSS